MTSILANSDLIEAEKTLLEMQALSGEIKNMVLTEKVIETFIDSSLENDPNIITWAYNKALQQTSS